jgi:hypothetical protein
LRESGLGEKGVVMLGAFCGHNEKKLRMDTFNMVKDSLPSFAQHRRERPRVAQSLPRNQQIH